MDSVVYPTGKYITGQHANSLCTNPVTPQTLRARVHSHITLANMACVKHVIVVMGHKSNAVMMS